MFKLESVQERASTLSEDLKVVAMTQPLLSAYESFWGTDLSRDGFFFPPQVPTSGRMMEEFLLFDPERSADQQLEALLLQEVWVHIYSIAA